MQIILALVSRDGNVGNASVDVPDSTAVSSTSSATSTASAPATSLSGSVTSQVVSNTPSSTGAVHATKTSNTGPIVGGVVGGVLGLLLIGAIVFSILLRHRRLSLVAQDEAGPATSTTQTIPRSGTLYGHSPVFQDQTSPADSMVYVGAIQSEFVRSRAHYRRLDCRTRMIRGRSHLIASSSGAWACLTRRWADICKSRFSCRAMLQVWDTARA